MLRQYRDSQICLAFSSLLPLPTRLVTFTRYVLTPSSTYQINWYLSFAIYVTAICECLMSSARQWTLRVGAELYTTSHQLWGEHTRNKASWKPRGVEVSKLKYLYTCFWKKNTPCVFVNKTKVQRFFWEKKGENYFSFRMLQVSCKWDLAVD